MAKACQETWGTESCTPSRAGGPMPWILLQLMVGAASCTGACSFLVSPKLQGSPLS